MKTNENAFKTELEYAKSTIKRLSFRNKLAEKLISSCGGYGGQKEHRLEENFDRFDLVFFFNPEKSASWGTHRVCFRKDWKNERYSFVFEQFQIALSEVEIECYQSFLKEVFEIFNALNKDFMRRNPVD